MADAAEDTPAVLEEVARHAVSGPEALERLKATRTGFAIARRAQRRVEFGPNRGEEIDRESLLEELVESFTEPLQLLLLAVGVLSAIFGELSDAVAIFAVIIAVAVLEMITEMRASRAIDAPRRLAPPTARLRVPTGHARDPRRRTRIRTSSCWRPATWCLPTCGC